MTAVDVRPMNETEARALTERIKASAEHLWQLLLEAHERKAWKALGYECWRDYARVEFGISQSRAYQILDQGKVIRAIEEAAGFQVPGNLVSSEAAGDIKHALPEVLDEIRDRVADGEEPEDAVRDTVAKVRPKRAKAGIVVTRGNAPDVAIQKAMDALDAMRVMFRNITLESLPEDAPADAWVREIDQTLKALRAMRGELRSRYGL